MKASSYRGAGNLESGAGTARGVPSHMIEETGEFALVTHLQAAAERDKASTARALHDDLGCLMVAAVMDLAWVEKNLDGHEDEVRRRLARVRQTLGVAIDAKRKIIEELRPSLLDDIGLFAA